MRNASVTKLNGPAARLLAFMAREAESNGQSAFSDEDVHDILCGTSASWRSKAVSQLLMFGLASRDSRDNYRISITQQGAAR